MTTNAAPRVIEHLRAHLLRDGADLTDGQLLECFLARREDAAFAALVRRHGPMVLGVCGRILRNHHDAEDAFQATFLVLARKAAAVLPRERVGNWLYGVALRTALRAKTTTAKQRARERPLADLPEPETLAEETSWREVQAVLDHELSRLPDKYRVPLVLCALEGRTEREAARQLGWPQGTLSGRLSQARTLLRKRLARHGLALSGGALTAALAPSTATASVPTALLHSTVEAASLIAAGQAAAIGSIFANAAALADGVLKAMWITKLKIAASVMLTLAVVAWGIGQLALYTSASEPPEPQAQEAPRTDEAAPETKRDAKASPATTVQSMPAVVVRTVPQAGDTQVDAATTKEIRVTYSKDMADRSWSWSQISADTFPEITGKPKYDTDRRTCILPVKLVAGKTYVLWLNPPKFQGFRDTAGKPAVFYPLVFETKP